VYIIDRYTYYALEFLERVNPGDSPQRTMAEFMAVCPRQVSVLNSVSDQDPESIRSMDPYPDPESGSRSRRAKMNHKIRIFF
jgi:hypothetical protein